LVERLRALTRDPGTKEAAIQRAAAVIKRCPDCTTDLTGAVICDAHRELHLTALCAAVAQDPGTKEGD